MVSVMKSALTVAIIASIACSGFAIKCFHCESTADTRCGDKFESQDRFIVDCERLQQQRPQPTQFFGPFYIANATGCVKRLFDYLPGQPRIQRTCFYGDAKHTAVGCQTDPSLPSQQALSCDVCTNDLCNGSSILKATGLGVSIFLVLMRLFI